MANERLKSSKPTATPKGYGSKGFGIALCWFGIVGLICSIGMVIVGIFFSGPDIEDAGAAFIGFLFVLPLSLLMMFIGAILLIIGRSQAKKQKDLIKANSQNGKEDK